MPKRAAHADAARLEAALSPVWRAALREAREVCALGEYWQAAEQLQVVATHVGALQLAARLVAGGVTEDLALEHAAAHLGIPVETVRTRQRRWFVSTRCHNEPAATPKSATSSSKASKPARGAAR
jgi:hypothetical protein